MACFADWPTHFVFGNVDDPTVLAEEIHAQGQTCHDRFGSITPADTPIAFLHGDDQARLDEAIRSGRWKMVCHGHTHVARELMVGDTLVLNPGALQRARTKTFAVVDLPSRECEFLTI